MSLFFLYGYCSKFHILDSTLVAIYTIAQHSGGDIFQNFAFTLKKRGIDLIFRLERV